MIPRFLHCAILATLVFALADSSPAGRYHPGVSRQKPIPSQRGWTASRAHLKLSPAVESLVLPRAGRSLHADGPDVFGLRAASAVLMDANSGAVLYERSPDITRAPASVTKILTALVILEHGRLSDMVTVSPAAARVGGYRLGLRTGQRISLGDLLAAILIRSANDAAIAAAEHVGGGLAGFVFLMNEKAAELGMTNSRFANPHGLDEPFHYTTARDMATLTRVALENPMFAELVRTRQAHLTIWRPGRKKLFAQTRIVQSHNRLLGQLDGADGVKTGYTDSAGGGLNDPRRWTDAAMLLEYGFGSNRDAVRIRPDGLPWHPEPAEGDLRLEIQARVEERP